MEKHVIEHAGLPVGVAVEDRGKVKFIAVKFHVMDLDAKEFSSLADLRHALQLLAAGQSNQLDNRAYGPPTRAERALVLNAA